VSNTDGRIKSERVRGDGEEIGNENILIIIKALYYRPLYLKMKDTWQLENVISL
jgi:hypothetical protein